ncbi:hypothetical protein Aperf_G00000128791 [Anoplocephala perfoliata]
MQRYDIILPEFDSERPLFVTIQRETVPEVDPACNASNEICITIAAGGSPVRIYGCLNSVPQQVKVIYGWGANYTVDIYPKTTMSSDELGNATTVMPVPQFPEKCTRIIGEMGGTEEVEEDHSGSTTEDLYEGSETTMSTGGTEEISDTPPAEPDIATEQINDFSSDTEMEGSDLTATAVTEDNNVDHSGVTTDYLEEESETTENTGSSEQISDFTSDTEMEVSDFIATSSESTSQQPNEGSTTASLISTTTSLEHPSPEPRCITSMNCNSRTCRGVASVGDCVDVTKNLNCFIRATVPHVKSNCNSTLGICVWTPDYGVVKINGTLRTLPYKVTVDRGFPVGNFVFDFVEGTKQGNKIASASSHITSPFAFGSISVLILFYFRC